MILCILKDPDGDTVRKFSLDAAATGFLPLLLEINGVVYLLDSFQGSKALAIYRANAEVIAYDEVAGREQVGQDEETST